MAERITSKDTRVWLKDYFRQRQDVGLWKALASIALSPPNPFKPEARRWLRSELLFAVGLLACAAGWFFYFNFVPLNLWGR